MANATVDTVKLAGIVKDCFAKAIDDRFGDEDQNSFLLKGKRLRAQLMDLLSAQFDAGSAPLKEANAELSDVDDKLSDDADVLAHTVAVLGEIGTLVNTLDNLMSAATGFL